MKKLILFFLQFPILFFGQQKVQILDSETSKPIPNARIISNNQVYYPNDEGFILLAENTGDLSISAFGYINQNIKYAPIIKLRPKYQDIDEVKITSIDVTKILKLVSKNYNDVYYDKPQLYDITISQRSFENNNMKLLMIADGKFWSRDGQYNAKEAFNNKYNNFLQVEIDHLRYLKSEKAENPVKVKKQDTSQDYTGDMFFSYELFLTLRLATGKNVKTSGKLLAENGDEQDISFMIKTDRNMIYKGFILYNKRDKAITHFELDFNQSSSEPYKLKDENGVDYQKQLGDGLIIFDFYKSGEKYAPSKISVQGHGFKTMIGDKTYEYRSARVIIFKNFRKTDKNGLQNPVEINKAFWTTMKVSQDKGDILLTKEEQNFINEKSNGNED
ncbi:hypothetical protein SAMN05660493_01264 [Epilithonimonas bovis DSM 19482]|uniref:CarboxypepD_reg-like domain-containing protein n=1 Tax=Epilithonimonas bovis DSM 19482 TaxID=1121284 RepID=A0A1U7PSN0_9FLAO|nr:hypothetical protein [Epilithonimonas bovis]SIT96576.1 hypothetical protein SAMN05660493_01264 [Epilithonimonas bovis DSM 19482]